MLLRSISFIFMSIVVFDYPLRSSEAKLKKEQEPIKTIFDLLYMGKLEAAVSLLQSLASDAPEYKDLLVGVQVQIMVHNENWDEITKFSTFPFSTRFLLHDHDVSTKK